MSDEVGALVFYLHLTRYGTYRIMPKVLKKQIKKKKQKRQVAANYLWGILDKMKEQDKKDKKVAKKRAK